MDEVTKLVTALNLPGFVLVAVTFGFSIYSLTRMAAETYDKVARILPLLDALRQ